VRVLLAGLLVALSLTSAPAAQQSFSGTVTDDTCGNAGHAAMRMGPTDAECTRLCVALHSGAFVLLVEKEVYRLSDQALADEFAGEPVVVTGTLDAETKTIRVASMKKAG
jgi:hypothetical protein